MCLCCFFPRIVFFFCVADFLGAFFFPYLAVGFLSLRLCSRARARLCARSSSPHFLLFFSFFPLHLFFFSSSSPLLLGVGPGFSSSSLLLFARTRLGKACGALHVALCFFFSRLSLSLFLSARAGSPQFLFFCSLSLSLSLSLLHAFRRRQNEIRCTPVRQDRIRNPRLGQHPERDRNVTRICIV